MPDAGNRATDRAYKALRRRIVKVYEQAYKDIEKKLASFTKRHEATAEMYRAKVKAGEITQTDYNAWMRGQVFQGEQWKARLKDIDATLYKADTVATQMVNESRYDVFAANANYIGYDIEHNAGINSGFTLYDRKTVTKLVKDNPGILPPRKEPGRDKSYKWYNGKVDRALSQGIIHGESIRDIAKRIGKDTGEASATAMLRNAHTAHTAAENAGRLEGMKQAEDLGIKLKKQWMATLDSHTRDTHADLDGQTVDIDKPFTVEGMEIMYPGDPNCEWPELVWNCRCTMVEVDPEFPDEMIERRDNETGDIIQNMTFREWEKWKYGQN